MATPSKEDCQFADANGNPMIATQQSNVAAIVVTYTAGSAPTTTGALTVANSATPTVVELLQYCADLDAKVQALSAVLQSHGLTA